jgi:hypothetical protein
MLAIALVLGVVVFSRYWSSEETDSGSAAPTATSTSAGSDSAIPSSAELATGRARIRRAFEEQEDEIWVEADGVVQRTLADDNEGSRHQKFIVDLDGFTVLISHNIDLAPRIPLSRGDRVVFRGLYEWNDRGGVVHWTHHDPQGRKPGGWITRDGETYR